MVPPRQCKLLASLIRYTPVYQVSFLNHATAEVEWKTGIHLYFVQYESNIPIYFKFGIAAKIHPHLKKVSKVF